MMKADLFIDNIEELVPVVGKGPLSGKGQSTPAVIKGGAVAISGDRIIAAGGRDSVLKKAEITDGTLVIDASGKTVIPGFVDPHTHLLYGGCRHWEFEERLKGTTYLEILKKGGGINDTVRATRNESDEKLLDGLMKRLRILLKLGTTSLEIKTGYGLSFQEELRLLKIIKRAKARSIQDVAITLLGAHALPPEYRDRRENYIQIMAGEMLDAARGFADFVDVFQDVGAFTYEEARKILKRAAELGYGLKLHADELSSSRGAELAGELGAVSADHLTHPSEKGLELMKKSGTVAVLLPGTTFFLGSGQYAPARKFIDMGIPVALATDHNPGTCPIYSMAEIIGLSVRFLGLTPYEALVASTLNAAHAIKMGEKIGSIEPGKQADLLILDAHSYVHIPYEFGRNLVETVIKRGKIVWSTDYPA